MKNSLNRILGTLNIQVNKKSSLEVEKIQYLNSLHSIFNIYQERFLTEHKILNNKIVGIVFSKNRAMQLHALLSSYFHFANNCAHLKVLFTYTNSQHKTSYEILQKEFATYPVTFIREEYFRNQLVEIVRNTNADRLFFMTDDAIFVDSFDFSDCLSFNPNMNIFSLRLGKDFNFCFTHNRVQKVPTFSSIDLNEIKINEWIWGNMMESPDWAYPLSLDATIFLKSEILLIFEHILFKNPNQLEAQMQFYAPLFLKRKGLCYHKTKYVNIPCNLVQTEYKNFITDTYSVAELLHRFLESERIEWPEFTNLEAPIAQQKKFNFKLKEMSSL